MAGIFSWVFTYPQDVIKSRLQADSFGLNQQYSSARHCLQASIETEGYGCLTRGIGSTIVRAFPMNAVTFGVYSYIMKRWEYKEEDRDLDTVENLKKNLQNHISELSAKLANILLGTLGLVARGKKTTSRVREQAGLKTGGLGVVVVTVSVSLRDVLEDDSPVSFNIDSTSDLGVINIGRTKVPLRSNPVSCVIRRRSLRSS